jgi:hypothetical protein
MPAELPTGAKLDRLVLWAVGVLTDAERGPYSGEIAFTVCQKAGVFDGFSGALLPTEHEERAVVRAVERLQRDGLVVLSYGGNGFVLVPDGE